MSTVPSAGVASFSPSPPQPGLLLAWAPDGAATRDRARVGDGLTVGRTTAAAWLVDDARMSSAHFRVRACGRDLLVDDLGSRNGTFVDGARIEQGATLAAGGVVRGGRSIFVAVADLAALETTTAAPEGMVGPFHAARIARDLEVAQRTGKHLLLWGESGSGKELCAAFLAGAVAAGRTVAHNCARFTSADEAEATLFGVQRGVFSGVEARASLLEEADGGVLFLDEVHALPLRVQQSLLRFTEDGLHARIGASTPRRLSVRLVLGTNLAPDTGAIAPDLLSRLYPVRVPPLSERRADVPAIFAHALRTAAVSSGLRVDLAAELSAEHFEALCLAEYTNQNVRALQRLAADVVARTACGAAAADAIREAFARALGHSLVVRRGSDAAFSRSHYEIHREQIIAAYRRSRGNLTATEALLAEQGLSVSRRWLAEFLAQWGVRAKRAPTRGPQEPGS